jgi:hypothetical protein
MLHGRENALEDGFAMFANHEVIAEVETLRRSLQERTRLAEEAIPLMEIPLRPPVQERRTGTRALDIEVIRILVFLNLGDIELNASLMPAGVGIFEVAGNPVLEHQILGVGFHQLGHATGAVFNRECVRLDQKLWQRNGDLRIITRG